MKLLFVEDGSVDTNELDKRGINYIVFRQGSDTLKIIEIDEGNLTKRYIQDINTISLELSKYKRALQLACNDIQDMYCSDYCTCARNESCKVKCPYQIYYNEEQFLNQAKKEFE